MGETVDKIQRMILESEVEERDKGLIFDLLRRLDETALVDIVDLIDKGVVSMEFFQRIWLEKKAAVEKGDQDLVLAVIKEELDVLKKASESNLYL